MINSLLFFLSFFSPRQKAARTREGFSRLESHPHAARLRRAQRLVLPLSAYRGGVGYAGVGAVPDDYRRDSHPVGCCREGVLRGEAEQTLARGNSARVRGYISFPSLTKMPEVV